MSSNVRIAIQFHLVTEYFLCSPVIKSMMSFRGDPIVEQIFFLKECLASYHTSDVGEAEPPVVVAGSAALYFSMIKRTGEVPGWLPNDIDVFVTGRVGSRLMKFDAVVKRFKQFAACLGRKVVQSCRHCNLYCRRHEKVWIEDIVLEGFLVPFSFIRYGHVSGGTQVVDGFDINIVKVWIHLNNVEERVSESVWESVRNRVGKAEVVVWKKSVPDKYEVIRFHSTLRRMKKFTERGFVFLAPPYVVTGRVRRVSI